MWLESASTTPADPVARAIEGLLDEVQSLRARVNELEAQRPATDGGAPIGSEAEEGETAVAAAPRGKC